VRNRRRVVYYAILLLLILGELLGERNYIIIIFPEYDNLPTKELGCNYWSTYTKSGIRGVQVISLHCDSIGVDNRSLGAKI